MFKCRAIKIVFLLFIFILKNGGSFAQQLDSLLSDADAKYPQEKIYIQYDRPYYNPGETIWFKAYIYPTNFPYTISKTAYAELVNEKGIVLQRKIMPVIERGAAGSFDVPDTLKSPVLYVRAYTAWMLNFDSSLQYIKPIRIVTKSPQKKVQNPEAFTVNFFPEGGDLISGIACRVAFKATNQDGDIFNINGNIVNGKGEVIMPFSSTHDGMGYFTFIPYGDEQYKAVWKDKKGVKHETALPVAKSQGVALNVRNTGSTVNYKLERPEAASEEFKSFYVVAKMQQQLLYSAKINLTVKTAITAPIPVDSLFDGILQLTVFNANKVPVAERLVFINHQNASFITDLHAPELDLGKRKHNTLQVDVGDTLFTNLSISVTDEGLSAPGSDRENIFSAFLLSSDLKGNIYNPAQYFSSDEDSVKQQLDLVMMTNGWRRIKWQDILSGNLPGTRYLPENNIVISGTVYGLSKTVLKNRELTGILTTKSGGSEFFVMPVEQDGTFKFDNVFLFDTAKLYYQFNGDKDKKLSTAASFTFNSSYAKSPVMYPSLLKNTFPPERPDSATENRNRVVSAQVRKLVADESKIKELSVVTVKGKIKTPEQKMDEEYASGLFSGGDGYTFLPDNDPFARGATSLLTYLQSKVAGMQITTGTNPSITWRGSPTGIFVNESPSEIDVISTISMSDVAMVKVFRPPFIGANGGGAGGAVAVYLKKGASANQSVKGLDFTNVAGFSVPKEFYSPDYEKTADANPSGDFRATLYWSPFLFFDKQTRRIKIPFFNSDNCKKIRVIIEGINSLGQFTHEEKVFF